MLTPSAIALLAELKEERARTKTPNVSDITGQYLYDLIVDRGYLRLLELGTANGYSTIYLAEAVGKRGGHVLTVETQHTAYLAARHNLAGYRSCVTQIHADAKEFCKSLSRETFDFAFIDASKKETLTYFLSVWPRIVDHGMIIIDDVVKFSDKMEDFYDFLEDSGLKHEIVMTDPDDGIMLISKTANL